MDAVRAAAPQFDIVRVTDLGNVLLAGKAPPRAQVAALIDEAQVANTVEHRRGRIRDDVRCAAKPHTPRAGVGGAPCPEGGRVRSADTIMLTPQRGGDGRCEYRCARRDGGARGRHDSRFSATRPKTPARPDVPAESAKQHTVTRRHNTRTATDLGPNRRTRHRCGTACVVVARRWRRAGAGRSAAPAPDGGKRKAIKAMS